MNIPEDWIQLEAAMELINRNLMYNNPRGVLDDWEAKYLNLRIDMRTGATLIRRGNVSKEAQDA